MLFILIMIDNLLFRGMYCHFPVIQLANLVQVAPVIVVGALWGHFRVPKTLTFNAKWGQVHNFSCLNELYNYENKKSFPYKRLST